MIRLGMYYILYYNIKWNAKKFKRSFLGVKVTCIFKGTMICNKLCIEVLICKREKNSRKILLDNFSTNVSKGGRVIYLFFKIINLLVGAKKVTIFCTELLMRKVNLYFFSLISRENNSYEFNSSFSTWCRKVNFSLTTYYFRNCRNNIWRRIWLHLFKIRYSVRRLFQKIYVS